MAKRKAVAVPVADVEMVEKPGLGIDEGVVLATFFLLVGAVILVYMANQTYLA
jgi:hypothetical protein